MGQPCHVPPGREWALHHCLPEIPGPQWDREPKFSPGVRAELERTKDCWVFTTVYVKRAGVLTRYDNVEIRGFLPWGWLKVCQQPPSGPPPAPLDRIDEEGVSVPGGSPTAPQWTPPPPAAETLERISEEGVTVPGSSPVASWTPRPPEQPAPDSDASCDIVPVPDVDVLVPWPLNNGYTPWPNGVRYHEAGALGNVLFRVCGSGHPLFSTSYGGFFLAREFASALGIQWMSAWHFARMNGSIQPGHRYYNQGRELYEVRQIFGDTGYSSGPGMSVPSYVFDPHWWTRDFCGSHIQECKGNWFAPLGVTVPAGVAGQRIARRWRFGGAQAAPYVGSGYDVLEEESTFDAVAGGYALRRGAWTPPMLPLFNEDGRRVDILAPELGPSVGQDPGLGRAPMQFRDRWEGGRRTGFNLWGGDAPGAHLP